MESARCIVLTRCGIDRADYDFSMAEKITSDIPIVDIGNAAMTLAQEVLHDIDRTIRRNEYEQYQSDVRRGHLRYPIRGRRRTSESEVYGLRQETADSDGTQGNRPDERNRPIGAGYGEHERTVSDYMERDRQESNSASGGDDRNADSENTAKRGLSDESDTAGRNRAGSSDSSMGNDTDLRGVAEQRSEVEENDESDEDDYSEAYEIIDESIIQVESDEDSAFVSYDGQFSLFADEAITEATPEAISDDYYEIRIKCEWSESAEFEGGKTYSVYEFDRIMQAADAERVAGAARAVEHYGSKDEWYASEQYDEYTQYMGYDKTKFSFVLPNGMEIVERQDIGDGYGGVIDYFRSFKVGPLSEIADILQTQADRDKQLAETKALVAKAELNAEENNHLNPELPDKTVSVEDMNAFGYEYDGMLPLNTERALELFDEGRISVYLLYEDGTEGMANDRNDIENHAGYFGVEVEDWNGYLALAEQTQTAESVSEDIDLLIEEFYSNDKKQHIEILKRGTPTFGMPFDVRQTTSYDGGKTYVYVGGESKFQKTLEDAQAYAKQLIDSANATEEVKETANNITEVRNDFAPLSIPQNYRFPNDFAYASGPKAKFADNIAAIKTLKAIERERRAATPAEQDILAHYSGWGGLSDAFDKDKKEWATEYAELVSLLTQDEYKAARASTLTAFYTEPYIIESIYKALESFGFKGGYILDPAMGTGNFYGNMPTAMAENSKLFGVELDDLTARIASKLYPLAEIQHKGFEQTQYNNGTFDVVVGNVPFSDFKPYDKTYDNEYALHDYFFIKSLDKLKSGGIAALITSKGSMEKNDKAARIEMYKRADFIGGIRLPVEAFKTAGTKTVTDILFFQKLDNEREAAAPLPDWVTIGSIRINDVWYYGNQYFAANPEMVLGESKEVSSRFGRDITVTNDGDVKAQLNDTVNKLSATFTAEPTVEELPEDETEQSDKPIPDGIRPYTYFVDDGKLYFAENQSAVPYEGKHKDRIIAMCRIAEQLDQLIAVQQENCTDEVLTLEQQKLNLLYDKFVAKYGYIGSKANNVFSDDIRAIRLTALDITEKEDGEITHRKADIFTSRTIKPTAIPKPTTAIEAMHLSLNRYQKINLEYMSEIYGKSEDDIIEELEDKIYCDPSQNLGDKYSGWVTEEEYLSGYVCDKLLIAKARAEENSDFQRNVEALEKNQPARIPITSIGFRLGTIYIPVEMYRDFIYETFDTEMYNRASYAHNRIDVTYNPALNEWKISNKNGSMSNVKVNEVFGTRRANAYELAEQLLNQRKVTIKDAVIDANGNKTYKVNKKETILARERQAKIENAFTQWVLADTTRRQTVEDIYNARYNNIKPRTYNGSYISIPEMNSNLSLRSHQKDVIARVAATGTCLMAHEVGAGKTAAMSATGMYLKSIGAISKPMYVVPNAVVAQFAEEFQRFFPQANILAATKDDMSKKNRRRFLSKIAVSNFDAIIIPQSQFESIPLSVERQEQHYQKKIAEIAIAISELKENNGERFSVKAMERQRMALEKKIEKLRNAAGKDDFITFEELGCDFLFVDEAHNCTTRS